MQRIRTGCLFGTCFGVYLRGWGVSKALRWFEREERVCGKKGKLVKERGMLHELLWCCGEGWSGSRAGRGGWWRSGSRAVPAVHCCSWLGVRRLLLPWAAGLAVYLPAEAPANEHSLFQLRIQSVFILPGLLCLVLHPSWEPQLLGLETSLPSPSLLNNTSSVLTQVVGFSLFLLINVCRSYNLLCVISSHIDCALLTWLSR